MAPSAILAKGPIVTKPAESNSSITSIAISSSSSATRTLVDIFIPFQRFDAVHEAYVSADQPFPVPNVIKSNNIALMTLRRNGKRAAPAGLTGESRSGQAASALMGGDLMDQPAGRTLDALDIQRLLTLLPHRYPFMLVDRIVDLRGRRILRRHQERDDERAAFHGPFPRPPGDARRAGGRGDGADGGGALCAAPRMRAGARRPQVMLMTIDKTKFRKPVVPGDQLRCT